jgi:flagellar protein FliO/FliZ
MPLVVQLVGLLLVVADPSARPAELALPPAAVQGKSNSALSLPPAGQSDAPMPLPPSSGNKNEAGNRAANGLPSAVTVAASLAVVLGLFFLVVWMFRRASPTGANLLPGEVVEVMGRAPLTGRQQMYLLRCGRKMVLVSVTPAGAETLTEVTDPVEVDRLSGLCQQSRPNSATATFRRVFQHFSQNNEDVDFADGPADRLKKTVAIARNNV